MSTASPAAAPAQHQDDPSAREGPPDSLSKPPTCAQCLPEVYGIPYGMQPIPMSVVAEDTKDSWSGYSDFESHASCSSATSLSSESSEIPEAILEESSDGDDTDMLPLPSSRPVAVAAWPAAAAGAPPSPAGAVAGSGEGAAAAWGGAARTPVRRARVRGTVCLPTSARGEPTLPSRPATALPRREGDPRWHAGRAVCARLEAERELASQRALRFEEALEAERTNYEAELTRQALEAADRQAMLQAINHDRTELAALYMEAHQELCRLRTELSERTVEVMELKQSQERLRRDVEMQHLHNTCVVCLDDPATMASVPCGHLAMCEACAARLDASGTEACPVCRRRSAFMHIFTP
mmetsp:Transcript_22530/g.64913  ORF Transcript_22530/g.64913 Transcript_22530/m.64913 type:complete len:353 (-) Transcript_22530:135-1193(-)